MLMSEYFGITLDDVLAELCTITHSPPIKGYGILRCKNAKEEMDYDAT